MHKILGSFIAIFAILITAHIIAFLALCVLEQSLNPINEMLGQLDKSIPLMVVITIFCQVLIAKDLT